MECYACFNGLSQEHLNPTFVRTVRKVFQMARVRFDPEPDVCPTAAFEPDRADVAARGAPGVFRSARAARIDRRARPRYRRGQDQRRRGRVQAGEAGFTIEFGRPGVGVWFRDIQKMCWALARAGVAFEKKNPVTSLMSDVATGTIREDILDEKVLSAIVEIKVPVERTEEVIRLVWEDRKADRHSGGAGRGRAVRRDGRGRRRRADSGKARLQAGARQDEHRARPRSQIRRSRLQLDDEHPASFGSAESFRDDYVVFAIASKGRNDEGALEKLRKFLRTRRASSSR